MFIIIKTHFFSNSMNKVSKKIQFLPIFTPTRVINTFLIKLFNTYISKKDKITHNKSLHSLYQAFNLIFNSLLIIESHRTIPI